MGEITKGPAKRKTGRPPKPGQRRTICLSIDADLADALDEWARQASLHRSEAAEVAFAMLLEPARKRRAKTRRRKG